MLVGFAFNAPVRSELLPFLVLSLLPVIVPPAVVPAGMRLAGQRFLPRPFVSTIGVVIAMQLAMTGLIVPLTFQERARRFSRHREEPASYSLSVRGLGPGAWGLGLGAWGLGLGAWGLGLGAMLDQEIIPEITR
jgi:hypothetical protein